jgi:hypothetical protein
MGGSGSESIRAYVRWEKLAYFDAVAFRGRVGTGTLQTST